MDAMEQRQESQEAPEDRDTQPQLGQRKPPHPFAAPPYIPGYRPGQPVWYSSTLSTHVYPAGVLSVLTPRDGLQGYTIAYSRGGVVHKALAYHHELRPRRVQEPTPGSRPDVRAYLERQ